MRSRPSFPLSDQPAGRCLMGASFGAVASLSTACRYPGFFGRLLLQSGSFAFTDIGDQQPPRPAVRLRSSQFVNRFRASPTAGQRAGVRELRHVRVADLREPLARAAARSRPGMDVRFVEARDGHNWENWRDRLRDGLSWLFPGPLLDGLRVAGSELMADVTRKIGLSLGADICWPICYEADPAAARPRASRSDGDTVALRRRAGDDRAVRPAPAVPATTSSSTG